MVNVTNFGMKTLYTQCYALYFNHIVYTNYFVEMSGPNYLDVQKPYN